MRRRSVAIAMLAGMVAWLGVFGVASASETSAVPRMSQIVTTPHPTPKVHSVPAPPGRQRTAPPGALSSQQVGVKIHHYNLCAGNDACVAHPELVDHARNLAAYFMTVDGGWFLSLNEVCKSDFDDLAKRLNSAGTMVYALNDSSDCDGPYGSAILHPGGIREGGEALFFPTQEAARVGDCGDEECRAMLCLRLGTYAGPMSVCTAHLETGTERAPGSDLTIGQAQANEYLWIATGYAAGRKRVLAGDLNLVPNNRDGQLEVDELPDSYNQGLWDLVSGNTYPNWEPDSNDNPVRRTPHSKIDYIWVDAQNLAIRPRPFCENNPFSSDHCYTSGEWVP
ncbi:endonuclease/exonuclease/phosphatase family protein [Spirillospora sp. NPDC047279]|uniref:endonuclease/exonuclease/phosphatase family protein n=1 Tax=Spirillospora sp. NPDC047279 TaxID=3155478 RepID=UPI003402A0B4